MNPRKASRLLAELALTGVASPLVFLLLQVSGLQNTVELWFVFPFLGFTYKVGTWINSVFPPHGGEWFAGLGTLLLAEVVPELIVIWIALFGAVKLIERQVIQEKRAA